MLNRKALPKKQCKYSKCKRKETPFTPQRPLQQCCSPECAYLYNKEKLDKETTKVWIKERGRIKAGLKTPTDWLDELRYWFNKFIRLRDKDYPCISCGTFKPHIKYDAGHFWAAGNYSFLRFHEDNVHKQCSRNCNKEKHGNVGEYRVNLIRKIGPERVQWLDDHRHDVFVYDQEEVRLKIIYYKKECKILEAA